MTLKDKWNEKEIKYKIYTEYPFRTKLLLILLLPILFSMCFIMVSNEYLDSYGNDDWFISIAISVFLIFIFGVLGLFVFFLFDISTRNNHKIERGPIGELDIQMLEKYQDNNDGS